MTKKTEFAPTPYYVLKSENQPIYPTIHFDDLNENCVCVYGFSDKPIYDNFIKSAGQLLTPYPLVKGYLSNQIADLDAAATHGVCLGLVILDATDSTQPVLSAATMAAVLLAQQEKSKQVPIEFELVFDPERTEYRFNDGFERITAIAPQYIAGRS